MKTRPSRIRLLKQLYRQFGLYFYIGLSALLILLGVSKHPFISHVRIEIADFSSRLVSIIYKPLEAFGYFIEYVGEYVDVKDENLRLKEENKKLLYWVHRSEQLEKENEKSPQYCGDFLIIS